MLLPSCFVKLPRTPDQPLPSEGRAADAGEPGTDLSPGGFADAWDAWPDWHWFPPGTDDGLGWDSRPWNGDGGAGEGTDGNRPAAWNCHLPPETFSDTVHASSFVLTKEALGQKNDIPLYWGQCGLEQPSSSPERGFLFHVDEPSGLVVTLECDAPCYAALMRNGCQYDNVMGCWVGKEGKLQFAAGVLPATYMLVVEFVMPPEVRSDPPELYFDLHVAINGTQGATPCDPATESADSQVASQCVVDEPLADKSFPQESSLEWEDEDDFHVQCSHLGVPADKVGGMPDEVHSFTADFPGVLPRMLGVSATFDTPPGQGAQGRILAVTTAPCGAADAVMACTWGDQAALTLENITVFPGETLYAVVDALGKDAFLFPKSVPYQLVWTLREPCY